MTVSQHVQYQNSKATSKTHKNHFFTEDYNLQNTDVANNGSAALIAPTVETKRGNRLLLMDQNDGLTVK